MVSFRWQSSFWEISEVLFTVRPSDSWSQRNVYIYPWNQALEQNDKLRQFSYWLAFCQTKDVSVIIWKNHVKFPFLFVAQTYLLTSLLS